MHIAQLDKHAPKCNHFTHLALIILGVFKVVGLQDLSSGRKVPILVDILVAIYGKIDDHGSVSFGEIKTVA